MPRQRCKKIKAALGHGSLSSRSCDGFLLLSLICTLVLFSVLAAVIVPMTGSSTYSRVGANASQRAFYLAESGYRYVASQYLHGGSSENQRDGMLETLHAKRFKLSDSEGFQLYFRPYFYKTISDPKGSNELVTKIPGENPPGRTIPSSGRIQVFKNGVTVAGPYDYRDCDTTNLPNVTFILKQNVSLPSIEVNATVLPIVNPKSSTQDISRDGQLILSSKSAAEAFPLYNGTFSLGSDDTVYHFLKRTGDTLYHIKKFADPDAEFDLSVSGKTDVVLRKFLETKSVGTFGSGELRAVRSVTYRGPIAALPRDQSGGGGGGEVTTVDLLELSNNGDSKNATGIFGVKTVGGRNALYVRSITGNVTESYVSRVLGSAESDLFSSEYEKTGCYLSYDAQVKIGMGIWSDFYGAFVDKPESYSAGITVRTGPLHNQTTFYGISFMRIHSDEGKKDNQDKTIESMIPSDNLKNEPMIVFWTRNNNQGNVGNHWLAYKTLSRDDYVVDSSEHLTDWSTILVRVVQAASITLIPPEDDPSASKVSVGYTVRGKGGQGSAKVIKKINDKEGNIVLLLSNSIENLYQPDSIEGYARKSSSERDNYIWVFYSDPNDHFGGDSDPLNRRRKGNMRGSILKWPPENMENWTADEDSFTLVQWNPGNPRNGSFKNSQNFNFEIMGKGNELNGIIRLHERPFVKNTPEVGVVSFGESLLKAHFDDFAYKIERSGGGKDRVGTGFLGSIQR